MWWYERGWLGWWIAFVLLFFVLPLAYGWGYRGWGPWYRRRPRRLGLKLDSGPGSLDTGWGWLAVFLWVVLAIALVWFIGAWRTGAW